jgi:hypothetical protein
MMLVRNKWLRIFAGVVGGTVGVGGAYVVALPATFRNEIVSILQATLFILGIASGFATYLVSNYVKGLRATSLSLIREVRDIIWRIYHECKDSPDAAVRSIVEDEIKPLTMLPIVQWFNPAGTLNWSDHIIQRLDEIEDASTRHVLLYQHLLENSNELARNHLRVIISQLHVEAAAGVVQLLVAATVVYITARLLPHGLVADSAISGVCLATLAMATMEVIHMFSWIWQQAREEEVEVMSLVVPDEDEDSDEDESQRDESDDVYAEE